MSWKLINKDYTGPDAAGGTPLSSFDLGYMLYDQAKQLIFRIGNTGSFNADYILRASGVNTGLVAAAEFSSNRIDWESSVHMSGLQPNEISDTMYMRFTTPTDAYITSGTMLIAISEREY